MRKTKHFRMRMQQRAVRDSDVELILQIGTQTDQGILVRDKDAQQAIAKREWEIERILRFVGQCVILQGDSLITTYKASPRRQKMLLRGSRGRRTHRRT